ncbi:MAG: NifB/NifX family molybdenum-iron cluster-binding protein [Candidatus Brocadiia bacterium]
MKVAIPLADGRLAMHFGHCQEFALFEIGDDGAGIVDSETLEAPPHQPGLLPKWLQENGADTIIAGGMGRRAQALFSRGGIDVVVGAPALEPRRIVEEYLEGSLETGENICDH